MVDDHVLVRAGLRSLLGQRFGDRFPLAEAASLSDALAYLKDHAGDVLVLLLDLHLSDTRGLAGLQLVRQLHPALPVIVVSGLQDARIQEETGMHGAVAYVRKTGNEADLHALLEHVEGIAAGIGSPRAAQPARSTRAVDDRLNKRQVQVLELILSSHDNQAIAHETGLSLGSVKNIVSSIFLVFNVRSRAELIGLFSN